MRLLRGDTNLSVRLGGHEAVINGGPDTTALDLAGTLGRRVSAAGRRLRRGELLLRVHARAPGPGLLALLPGAGLQWQVARNVSLLVEGGIGMNANSPHYLGGGFAFQMPTGSGSGQGRQH